MAVTLNNNTDCCESTCTNTTVNVAGPQGPAGAAGSNGTNGSNGVNAYAFTTAGFTVPSVSANVSLSVDNATPWANGMIIFIQVAGYYEVVGTSGGTINAKNLGYTGNAAVGQAIATNRLIAGAGIKGDTGTSGTTFSGFTNAGDIITRDGSAQTVLSVDSTPDTTKALFQHSSGNKITWKKVAAADLDGNISLASQVSGSLPLVNVGNGISGAAAGDLLYWTGTAWARVAPPSDSGQVLEYNTGTNQPNWVNNSIINIGAKANVIYTAPTSSSDAPDINDISISSGDVNIASTAIASSISAGLDLKITLNFTEALTTSFPTVLIGGKNSNGKDVWVESVGTSSVSFGYSNHEVDVHFDFAILQ
jgi:hypothetical protein